MTATSRASCGVFKKFKGKLLVADAHPVVLEGEWPRDKVVIMEFPDDAAAQEFQNAPEYQEISVDRKAGADASCARRKRAC